MTRAQSPIRLHLPLHLAGSKQKTVTGRPSTHPRRCVNTGVPSALAPLSILLGYATVVQSVCSWLVPGRAALPRVPSTFAREIPTLVLPLLSLRALGYVSGVNTPSR